jgi:hypothetical protein
MGDNLNVLQKTREILRSGVTALSERQRRMAGIAGLNVLAVGLAFAALQIGGAIVSRNHEPSVSAAGPRASTVVAATSGSAHPSPPVPHRTPPIHVAYAATPDRAVLFGEPVLAPSSFSSDPPAASTQAFVVPAAAVPPSMSAATPPVVTAPPGPVTLAPVVPAAAKKAVAHLHAKTAAAVQIADNNLDVEAAIAGQMAASVAGVGITAGTGLGLSADSAVGEVAGGVGGVASSASAAIGSVASNATGAVGGAVGAVGGVAAGVGVGAR